MLAAAADKDLRALMRRAAEGVRRRPVPAQEWSTVLAAEPGTLLTLKLATDGGFVDEDSGNFANNLPLPGARLEVFLLDAATG